jgi:hypothetical protein
MFSCRNFDRHLEQTFISCVHLRVGGRDGVSSGLMLS